MLYCSTFINSKLFVGAYFAWWLYFKGLKFGDLTRIRQIRSTRQSFWFHGIAIYMLVKVVIPSMAKSLQ